MTYRDDFYTRDNIVGYTVDIDHDPTVYFETYTEHGRITQAHKHWDNIGRNRVKLNVLFVLEGDECVLYNFRGDNQLLTRRRGGQLVEVERLYERYESHEGLMLSGFPTHTSRNTIVTDLGPAELDTLALALQRFPDEKPRDTSDGYVPMRQRYGLVIR